MSCYAGSFVSAFPSLLFTLFLPFLAVAVLSLSNYLKEALPEGSVVGLDPRVHPIKFVTSLAKTLAPKKITLQPIGTALPSLIPSGQHRLTRLHRDMVLSLLCACLCVQPPMRVTL